MTSLVELLTGMIGELPVASVLRERLELAKERADWQEQQIVNLKAQVASLNEELADLRKELSNRPNPDEFYESRGALFKKRPGGGYHNAVFCPSCKLAMAALEGELNFHCERCQFTANFTGDDLPKILGAINVGKG